MADPFAQILQSGSLAYTNPSPASVNARRALAKQLLESSYAPNSGALGALAQTLGGGASGYNNRLAAEEETAGMDSARSAVAQALQSPNASFEDLANLSSNPWLNQNQSGLVNSLLGRQVDAAYPQITANQSDFRFSQNNPGFEDFLQSGESGQGLPANIREWEYYNSLPDDATKADYLRMKRANPYLDVGTGFVQPDPVNPGTIGGPEIAKDSFTPAYDKEAGSGQAKVDVETQAAADSLESKLPGLRAVTAELSDLADKATYTQTGQLWDAIVRETGQMPPEGAIARTKYMAMVDNQVLPLLRDTFGAAFTVKEGETLRATLGDPNKSPVEKKAILEAFIEQKVRDLDALKSRLPDAATDPAIDDLLTKYSIP